METAPRAVRPRSAFRALGTDSEAAPSGVTARRTIRALRLRLQRSPRAVRPRAARGALGAALARGEAPRAALIAGGERGGRRLSWVAERARGGPGGGFGPGTAGQNHVVGRRRAVELVNGCDFRGGQGAVVDTDLVYISHEHTQ